MNQRTMASGGKKSVEMDVKEYILFLSLVSHTIFGTDFAKMCKIAWFKPISNVTGSVRNCQNGQKPLAIVRFES